MLIEAEDQKNQSEDLAKEKARDAAAFHHALAILDDFRNKDERLNFVLLEVDKPVTVEPQITT